MKLIKLSLVAALAAGTFSAANAVALEEAIKDIDVSGMLRYRYVSGQVGKTDGFSGRTNASTTGTRKQDHQWKAQLGVSAAIADDFKAFLQLNYGVWDGGYGANNNNSDTKGSLEVRQYYLTYAPANYNTAILFGKQQLNTIWTDNGFYGLVGTGAKIINNDIEGVTLAAYAFDSYSADSDGGDLAYKYNAQPNPQHTNIYRIIPGKGTLAPAYSGNIYGVAALGSYQALGGDLNSQLWLAYFDQNAFYYALDLKYNTTFSNDVAWELEGAYLGNSVDSDLKDNKDPFGFDNGNLFGLRGTINYLGFDATLGGLYYGDKSSYSFNVIEDQGNIGSLLAGKEIFYTDGSNLSGDLGRNIFGFVQAGYTYNEAIRLGVDVVYGGTKADIAGLSAKKFEVAPSLTYKYSPKLAFEAWYSYVDVSGSSDYAYAKDGDKNSVRIQALYKF